MLLAIALLAVGCEQRDVRQYTVPHEDAPTELPPPRMGPVAAEPAAPAADAPPSSISYDVPDGWRELGPASMRIAGFGAGEGDDAVQITVTRFKGDVGGVASNVRRWAGQVGAAPPDEAGLAAMTRPYEGMPQPATLADIVGPQGRIYVVFLQHRGETWFFKLSGKAKAVDTQREAMTQFLSSVRFVEASAGE
jgi:hypothetical protein